MANLLLAIERPELCDITFTDANHLAATEVSETASFFTGGILAVTELAEEVSFSINTRSITIEAVESPDTASINILSGEVVELSAIESSEIGAINIFQGEVVQLTAIEVPETATVDILQGEVVELSAIEIPETAIINILQGEVIHFDAVDAKETASINGYNEILGSFSVTELLEQASIHILTGTVGVLVGIEPQETVSVTFSANTTAQLGAIESVESASFFIRQIPVTYVRMAVVMDISSHAVTEYKNFNFNSLAHFQELFLGASESGIYVVGGKDDLGVPIQADIRTGIQDFDSDGVIKYPKEAWLAYRTDGQLQLDVEVEEGESYPYIFERTHSNRITEVRETLGKGLNERFYTFTLKNLSGSDFDLESFRVLGDIISSRRR